MSSKLNGHLDAAKDFVSTTQEGAAHLASSTRGRVADGLHVIGGVVSMLRSLGVGDALGWVGLARKRSSLSTIAAFGAGCLAGVGVGMVFAPKSGAETRRLLWSYLSGAEKDAENVMKKVEDKLEHGAEAMKDKLEHGAEAMKDAAKAKVETATHTVKDAVHDAKGAVNDAAKSVLRSGDYPHAVGTPQHNNGR